MVKTIARRQWFVALTISVVTLGAALWHSNAMADQTSAWPERAVNFIVPFPPGGPVDTAARFVTKPLAEGWDKAAIVDNRAGAGGIVAARYAAKEKPDGYNYIQADFEPVGSVARFPIILVVHPSLGVETVQELVDYAKANPGKVSYSSSGTGGGTHLAGELFNSLAQVKLQHIPYRGSAPAMQDLVGGQVQVMFADAPSALPFIKSGVIKALAVGNPQRSSLVPDLPTIAESGVDGYEAYSWSGLLAPKGTPQAVVNQLNTDLQAALSNPTIAPSMAAAGAEPMLGSPQEFADFLNNEIKKWGEIIQDANIKIE